jgi:hypothetical protein
MVQGGVIGVACSAWLGGMFTGCTQITLPRLAVSAESLRRDSALGGYFTALASTLITLRTPGARRSRAAPRAYWRVNTAWTVTVLLSDAMRSGL